MSNQQQTTQNRRRYDPAFKQDAVDRVLRTGKSCSDVARELGVKPDMVARWRREHIAEADRSAPPGQPLKPGELADQLQQAHREIHDLREQRDILKKALSIFSRTPSSGGR